VCWHLAWLPGQNLICRQSYGRRSCSEVGSGTPAGPACFRSPFLPVDHSREIVAGSCLSACSAHLMCMHPGSDLVVRIWALHWARATAVSALEASNSTRLSHHLPAVYLTLLQVGNDNFEQRCSHMSTRNWDVCCNLEDGLLSMWESVLSGHKPEIVANFTSRRHLMSTRNKSALYSRGRGGLV
jgi:hypothetical protein